MILEMFANSEPFRFTLLVSDHSFQVRTTIHRVVIHIRHVGASRTSPNDRGIKHSIDHLPHDPSIY